jgi:hypothetical protein
MFGLPLREAHGAGASNLGRPVARTVAIRAAEALWLALIAVLFVAWAMSQGANQSRGWVGLPRGCVSAGKGGVVCNGSASAAQQVTESDPCISLGRGGRYCPRTSFRTGLPDQ